MVDSVDSERDYVGQTFKASLDEPVLDPGGRTLVPRGADVVVKLVDDVQSGKIEGRTVLTLDIVSLRVNGRDVDVDTTSITEQQPCGRRVREASAAPRLALSGRSRAEAKAQRSAPAQELGRARWPKWQPRVNAYAFRRRRG